MGLGANVCKSYPFINVCKPSSDVKVGQGVEDLNEKSSRNSNVWGGLFFHISPHDPLTGSVLKRHRALLVLWRPQDSPGAWRHQWVRKWSQFVKAVGRSPFLHKTEKKTRSKGAPRRAQKGLQDPLEHQMGRSNHGGRTGRMRSRIFIASDCQQQGSGITGTGRKPCPKRMEAVAPVSKNIPTWNSITHVFPLHLFHSIPTSL